MKLSKFMESGNSFRCSEGPATGPYMSRLNPIQSRKVHPAAYPMDTK